MRAQEARMTTWERWKQYPVQTLLALDQLANALIPPFFTLSYADETLSARTYRAARRGRIVGRTVMPVIDLMFRWQGPEHCRMAYVKEMERRNLPPEYREKTSR
jgi:hypothetical protein